MSYKAHTHCRVCKSDKLTQYIDLGNLPLSNNLCLTGTETPETYPLQVMLCENCGLSQLSIVVDPELLFGHYVYRSSISQGYRDHCRKMAKDLKVEYVLTEDSFMIDIAGNDGCLLKEFKEEIGLKCLNIDPAKNLFKINEDQGVRMYNTFWGTDAAGHLQTTGWPLADLITATNVFAHVDDCFNFLLGVKMVLKHTGVLIIEMPYLIDFIENNEFDTIYFEHLSYFSINPLCMLCNQIGLIVMKVEEQNIHGGTVRIYIGYGEQDDSVGEYVQREMSYRSIEPYLKFAENAKKTIADFRNKIIELDNEWVHLAAFACSAKGNTLLNCAGITSSHIDYIVDQTPEKIGKFSPGTHIEVVSMDALKECPPDYLIILSWNFAKEIKEKCRSIGYVGKFIIPIPNFEITD